MKWSFSYNSFVKFPGKKFGSRKMTMLYPNLCYNEARIFLLVDSQTLLL